MRKFRAGALAAGVVAAILMVPGVAYAHHVYLDFEATGDQVPGGEGDPDGSAVGTLDFNMEESMQLCIDGEATDLDAITEVVLLDGDGMVVADFGNSLDTCIESDEATLDGLHDNAEAYLLVVATEEFPEGAVASGLVEQEPSTTTTEEETTTSSSTAATVAATAAATTPRFTG